MKLADWTNGAFLTLAAITVTWFVFREGGWLLVWKGTREGAVFFLKLLPIFLVAFWIVGQSQVLMDRHMEEIKELVSGGKGILVAWIGGIFAPSTLAIYPLLKELWEVKRIGLAFTVTLVLSFTLLNLQIIPFRIPLLGWNLTWTIFSSSLLIPPLVGGTLLLIERWIR